MAASIVRKSASSLAPLALRTLRSQRNYRAIGFCLAKTTLDKNRSLSPMFPTSQYSSQLKKLGSDESLLRVLDSEINCAEESDDHEIDEFPSNFPFEIEDNPGQQTITLKRRYQDEDIHVVVHMPSVVSDEGNEYENEIVDEESERGMQSNVPLVVNVSKKGGSLSLEFICTAYPDEIAIESMVMKDSKNTDDQFAYEGPDFSELDDNLQKSFHKYLEIRGIRPSTTNFVHEYMINKDSKEYLLWLKKVKNFIQA